ncbi:MULTISPECIES: phage antirepressor KilAC domain-containing protein [Clostridium]|uniref:KilA protein, phage-related DNA binding protein n=1 Tax=Clostridium carnis TaxID=1530 RepID=A0ABY6ST86_9CLOT|nr:phage antirepressor KilAC domain-containing protein [Clostridium carnis]CAI3662475.1 anti-repressor protein [Clostridium neonatale]CAI3662979.1 anti-repressor protein [Clostridium neonatale]CAI3683316.1 anti-repressor protein [Clostridium neonatale]CAI3694729.1 anti-repressor protein [Clostridium neonatale]CAI3707151.1 anti-repressor protein [Clostridium neonatale]
MSKEIQIINQQEVLGKDFKIYGTFDNPLFKADDVAEWIEHSNTSMMLKPIEEDEKILQQIGTLNNAYSAWFLTEDGLYEVLMQSRKPIAKKFKKEVKKILKDVRKHGMYATDELLDNPDLLIEVATKLKEEREKNKALEEENAQKTQIIGELQPKASYYDLILQNNSLVAISVIGKDYGMSGTALNKKLHELGVQYLQGKTWLLYAKYQDKGYTFSKTQNYPKSDGTQGSKMHTYWTQKGRLFIYDLLKQEGILPIIEREVA